MKIASPNRTVGQKFDVCANIPIKNAREYCSQANSIIIKFHSAGETWRREKKFTRGERKRKRKRVFIQPNFRMKWGERKKLE